MTRKSTSIDSIGAVHWGMVPRYSLSNEDWPERTDMAMRNALKS